MEGGKEGETATAGKKGGQKRRGPGATGERGEAKNGGPREEEKTEERRQEEHRGGKKSVLLARKAHSFFAIHYLMK